VRRAVEADAAAIAGIHVRGWRAAYRGLVSDTLLAGLSVERREHAWRGLIAAARGASVTRTTLWVLALNDPAVAFYRRFGFEPDGASKDDAALGASEVRLVRALG
jgi:GNAT superfamily N-acetyltransferase